MTTSAEVSAPSPPTGPVVALRGVTKRFPGVLAVDAVDLAVEPGEVHVVAGENGPASPR